MLKNLTSLAALLWSISLVGASTVRLNDGKTLTSKIMNNELKVTRTNRDKTPDRSFGREGTTTISNVFFDDAEISNSNVKVLPTGKIQVTAETDGGIIVVSLTADGFLDTKFNAEGSLPGVKVIKDNN